MSSLFPCPSFYSFRNLRFSYVCGFGTRRPLVRVRIALLTLSRFRTRQKERAAADAPRYGFYHWLHEQLPRLSRWVYTAIDGANYQVHFKEKTPSLCTSISSIYAKTVRAKAIKVSRSRNCGNLLLKNAHHTLHSWINLNLLWLLDIPREHICVSIIYYFRAEHRK